MSAEQCLLNKYVSISDVCILNVLRTSCWFCEYELERRISGPFQDAINQNVNCLDVVLTQACASSGFVPK